MDEIVSSVPVTEIDIDAIAKIDSTLPDAQIDITKSITVEVQPENYVLTSGGIYTGNMTGAVPTWILNAIQQQLTTGDGNLSSVLDDIRLLLDGLQVGVNQAISQIESTNASMSALETSVVSRLNGNDAAILDVYATKVTPAEAQAIAVQAIGSTFNGNVDAYIGNLASVYTNPTSAVATDIHTLQVSYNDQTARIDTVEEVSLTRNATIRSATAPTIATNPLLITGDFWINTTNNVTKSWNGTAWVDITNTNAQQAYTWSATASKLITAPDGSVTGWSFGDGSNTKSNFKIKATNFSISDGTTGYTPFSITGSDINFLGKVSFSSVTGTPTHTSGLLSARPTTAVLGSTYVATNESNKLYTYTATGWKVGGATSNEVVADINAGNTTTIDGGKITTGSISAGQIAANTITADKINAGVLYNIGGNSSNYTMMINFNTGEIHIR